ncbi:MAG: IS110 family transposase [Dysgonamonadaceae bacterium]|nr:IS110 family transposase [Dysgonamonadaceae bacterium]
MARSLRGKELTGIYVPQRKTMEDRTLIRLRYANTKDLGREKNRIKSLLNFYGIEQPESFSSNRLRNHIQYTGRCFNHRYDFIDGN